MLTQNDLFASELERLVVKEMESIKETLANPALALEPTNNKYILFVGRLDGMRAVLGYFDEVKKLIAERT